MNWKLKIYIARKQNKSTTTTTKKTTHKKNLGKFFLFMFANLWKKERSREISDFFSQRKQPREATERPTGSCVQRVWGLLLSMDIELTPNGQMYSCTAKRYSCDGSAIHTHRKREREREKGREQGCGGPLGGKGRGREREKE